MTDCRHVRESTRSIAYLDVIDAPGHTIARFFKIGSFIKISWTDYRTIMGVKAGQAVLLRSVNLS